jgi:cell division protein FtsQ
MWSKIKYILSAVIVLLLAILLIVGYNYLKDPKHLPIKTVKVDGKLNYLQPDQLQAVIEPHMAQSFFMLDVQSIQQALSQEPWMAHSSVRRVWPDTVSVHVQEHEPLAFWGNEGLISQETVLFRPQKLPAIDLPRLYGPDEQPLAVLGMFNTLNRLLAEQDVHLVGLKLNARRAWQADLDNGMHVQLGSVDVVERFERFLKSYPLALAENASQIRYVDLRYTNGFVIAQETVQ